GGRARGGGGGGGRAPRDSPAPRRAGPRRRGGWSGKGGAPAAADARPAGRPYAHKSAAVAASQPRSNTRQARSPRPRTAITAAWMRYTPGRFMSNTSRYGTPPWAMTQAM